ncbi:hypothetical protein ACQP1K_23690 [Sphaerimonospora sp. CA-214678]|uniref:hypothetical protein n=1 Tax=Sphaerimonospora sp. CA-214678 TaxID=3240029 RepID=UPI003D8E08CF
MTVLRKIAAGLTISTALAGGIVALGAITSATAAGAAVVQGQFDDGLFGLDGAFTTGFFNLAPTGRTASRNNDDSINVIGSFNRQTALQRLRQRNEDRRLLG